MDEGQYWIAVIVFFVVWIECTIGFGPLGFLLGWAPALILAMLWPLIAALGCFVIVILVILMALLFLLYFASQSPASS
jgi:hypothetical protein